MSNQDALVKMKDVTAAWLAAIRRNAPLVHNITNYVVMNSSANILLALGASPVMAHSRREVGDMAAMAGALVLNIGTLSADWVESMLVAGKAANVKGIPVILDPVGTGATTYRTDTARRILDAVDIAVIRGNASEVMALTAANVTTRGVDSSLSLSEGMIDAAAGLARRYDCVVAVSGEKDLIIDKERVYRVANGVSLMTRVTGLGCGLSAVTGAFCAVGGADRLDAVAAAFGFYGLCGEVAASVSDRPGSFYPAFVDSLYSCGHDAIYERLRITMVSTTG